MKTIISIFASFWVKFHIVQCHGGHHIEPQLYFPFEEGSKNHAGSNLLNGTGNFQTNTSTEIKFLEPQQGQFSMDVIDAQIHWEDNQTSVNQWTSKMLWDT